MIPLIVNGPAIEPIALADAKKWLRLQTTRRNGVVQGFKSAPLLRRKEETMLLNKSVQFGLAALAQVGLARQAEADAQARHAKDATDSAFDSDFQRKD